MREVAADVDRTWHNAMKYNADDSYYYDAARELKAVSDALLAPLFVAADASVADGSSVRRSGRTAGKQRVDYSAMGGGQVAMVDTDEDTSWRPPLWFELQTDSDDSDGEACRKKELKRRDAERKRRADAKAAAVEAATEAAGAERVDAGAAAVANGHGEEALDSGAVEGGGEDEEGVDDLLDMLGD